MNRVNDVVELLKIAKCPADCRDGAIPNGPSGEAMQCQFCHEREAAIALPEGTGGDNPVAWLIWSNDHNCYWRANSAGYTRSIKDAGRYSHDEAEKICRSNSRRSGSDLDDDVPAEMMVLAPESIGHYTHPPTQTAAPIPMLLFCPKCTMQHIDKPQPEKDWGNPPHRSHECQHCSHVWRPADVATTGVEALNTQGKRDGSAIPAQTVAVPEGWMLFPIEAWDFLRGVGTLDGHSFGESELRRDYEGYVLNNRLDDPRNGSINRDQFGSYEDPRIERGWDGWKESHRRYATAQAARVPDGLYELLIESAKQHRVRDDLGHANLCDEYAARLRMGSPSSANILFDFANQIVSGRHKGVDRRHVAGIRAAAIHLDKLSADPAPVEKAVPEGFTAVNNTALHYLQRECPSCYGEFYLRAMINTAPAAPGDGEAKS